MAIADLDRSIVLYSGLVSYMVIVKAIADLDWSIVLYRRLVSYIGNRQGYS